VAQAFQPVRITKAAAILTNFRGTENKTLFSVFYKKLIVFVPETD